MKAGLISIVAVLCALSAGCAPPGYVYDVGSFVPRREQQLALMPKDTPTPAPLSQKQNWRLLDGHIAPPISDCQAWKEIDRKIYRAPSTGLAVNDFAGETIKDIYQRGWPEDAAKQLLVVIFASYENSAMNEEQLVADQFSKCLEVAGKPGPKYTNVDIGLYWSSERKAKTNEDFARTQQQYARRQELLLPCLFYKSQAMMVQIYKDKGYSMQEADLTDILDQRDRDYCMVAR